MHADAFDEAEVFRAIARSKARALLIGRRALIAIGIPVLTADYDLWIDGDDAASLNAALEPLDYTPTRTPEQARQFGRYVLEDHYRIDVLIARQASTKDGVALRFEDAWQRRCEIVYEPGVTLWVPSIEDLILTKRWAMRDKDVADIRLLEAIRGRDRV